MIWGCHVRNLRTPQGTAASFLFSPSFEVKGIEDPFWAQHCEKAGRT